MNLRVLLPSEIVVDEAVQRIVAEAESGYFCILPRHTDLLAALVPGILTFQGAAGVDEYLAVDEGILLKHGAEVTVATRHAVRGADLGALRQAVDHAFDALDDRERALRSAAAKLESDFVRRFLDLDEGPVV